MARLGDGQHGAGRRPRRLPGAAPRPGGAGAADDRAADPAGPARRLVEAEGGGLRLAALNPRPVASDRVLQLWALPPGATAPTSLGLIPPEGRISVSPGAITPQPGMLIEITLEPPGGSPYARPSGPIQFIGRLAPATGS
ncbi:anti-sigma factor domain-containing protein [Teichococcus aestuarii]|uniref:anti-sigma factor domain-containing protein n=1 Tax=Teichococcus aestuarii TaxID=568898 RepID=UPI003619B4E9